MSQPKQTMKPSALYRFFADHQGDKPWGKMLDAGTGVNSINWVSSLKTDSWTAVTGSQTELKLAQDAVRPVMRSQDRLMVGNWADGTLLQGEVFDTVLADYLMGAIDGFSPYFQPYLFPRLRPMVRDRLYVTGLEPYVPGDRPQDPGARVIWEVGRLRDAAMLLKGGMPYREYPAPWVADHVQGAGFQVTALKHFKIAYKMPFIDAQLAIALHALDTNTTPDLTAAITARAQALRLEAEHIIDRDGALRGCRNYVIVAQAV